MFKTTIVACGTTASAIVATAVAHGQVDGQRRPLEKECHAPSLAAAQKSLRASGVAVIDGVMDAPLVAAVRATEAYQGMPLRVERSPGRVGSSRRGGSERATWTPSALGRMHRREETLDAGDRAVFERVEKKIWPLVKDFFDGDATDVFRSEMQLLNAMPGGMSQAWHKDNHARGLSIIIPLVDFTLDNGATQLLPGSHERNWRRVAETGASVVVARLGSVCAYDSRTYHRGLVNETKEGRPAIILCYDQKATPPPGIGTYGSMAHSYAAVLLNIASTYWLQLQGATRGS